MALMPVEEALPKKMELLKTLPVHAGRNPLVRDEVTVEERKPRVEVATHVGADAPFD